MALDQPSTSGAAGPSGRPAVKLFLGGLSWETTEEKVREHFGRFGEIGDVTIMRDRLTDRPRGFGFLTYVDEEVADRVCLETHVLDGRQIDAKRSVPQELKPKSKKIFVGGLAPDTTEDQFKAYFERFGTISDAQIMQDHTSGRSRGFGFITYEDESAVDRVFGAGPMHDLVGKKVEVKPATPRGSGPQGRGALPDRGPGGYRGLSPAGRGPYPAPFSGAAPRAQQPAGTLQPGQAGPYGLNPAPSGIAFAPGVVNPYGMSYQMPYYGSMMVQQLTPYGYGGYGFPAPYGAQPGVQAQTPPGTPASFEGQPHTPHGPPSMGPFGPGPGPGRTGGGPPRFPPGRSGSRA